MKFFSNLIPLWTETFSICDKEMKIEKVVDYINKEELEQNSGGLPTTKIQTGSWLKC